MLKRYGVRKRDVWYSIIYGGVVGLLGVVIFVVFLKMDLGFTNEKIDVLAPTEEKLPLSSEAKTFYAIQHGVFSSEEQAQSFLASDPALMTALSIPIGGRFYVWSKVASEEISVPKGGTSFLKTFTLDGAACTEESLRTLPKWLASENNLKFNFGKQQSTGVLPKDWSSVRTTAVGISEDMDVARLHLIFHYLSSSKCINLKFN